MAESTDNKITLNAQQFAELVRNEWGLYLTRTKNMLSNQTRRDLEAEADYPPLDEPYPTADYQTLFDRDAMAARVVEVWPRESWQVQPKVYEDESPEVITPFEQSLKDLQKCLQGPKSWYEDEKGIALFSEMKTADELSGIGRFGILLHGFDDGEDLSKPVKGVIESNSVAVKVKKGEEETLNRDNLPPQPMRRYTLTTNLDRRKGKTGRLKKRVNLLYLRSFSEYLVEVQEWEGNYSSPRFGMPLRYSVTFSDPRDSATSANYAMNTREVHWTRVTHLADTHHTASSHKCIAIPRMRPVLNDLLGLRKLYIGSPEMFWKAAYPGLALTTPPQLADMPVNPQEVKDQLQKYFDSLDRSIVSNLTLQQLSPTVSDPSPQIQVLLNRIGIKLSIPMRILMGSERGELASSQDDTTWNTRRVPERQMSYNTPRIVAPVIDLYIMVGALEEPSQYHIYWPDISNLSVNEKAQKLQARTSAMASYVGGGLSATLMAEKDYLTKEMEFSDEEAESILQNRDMAKEEQEAEALIQQEEQAAQQEDMIKRGLAPDPLNPMQVEGKDTKNPFQKQAKQPGNGKAKPKPFLGGRG